MSKKTIVRCVASIEVGANEYETQDILNKIIGKSAPFDDKIVIRIEEILTLTSFPQKHKEITQINNEKEVRLDEPRAIKDPIAQGL